MKLKMPKLSFENIFLFSFFFYSYFFPLSISEITGYFPVYNVMYLFRNISLLITILITILIFLKKWLLSRGWFKYLLISLVFFISGINAGIFQFFTLIIFCFFLNPMNFKRILKALGLGNLLGAMTVILLSLIGFIPNDLIYDTGRYRMTFGFILPVLLPGIILNIGYVFVYLNRESITLKKIMVMLIPGLIIYIFARGRASFFALVVILIGTHFTQKLTSDNRKQIIAFLVPLIKFIYVFSFLFSIYVGLNFEASTLLQSWNRFFTGRLGWISIYWNLYTPQLFGQYIIRVGQVLGRATGQEMMILDNAALTLLLENGIIVTAIFTWLLFSNLNRLKRTSDLASVLIWFAIIMTFPVANNGLWIWRNPLLFQFYFVISKEEELI